MLYPFAPGEPRRDGIGAAAGGCMLVRREALGRGGGIAAIRSALIDDCALGALLKRQGPIWLGLTDRARSIRPYDGFGAVAAMIARSAYAQLALFAAAAAGHADRPRARLCSRRPRSRCSAAAGAQMAGIAAWALMALAFQPMLRFLSPFAALGRRAAR